MKRRHIILVAVLLVAAVVLAGLATAERSKKENNDLYKELELFSDTVSIIRSEYVEEPSAKDLVYGALKGMLSSLDPYSQFMDPDTYNEMKVETEGEFGGIGIEITIKDDLLTIISPLDDTPAFNAGLKAGDRIVKIDGEITKDLTLTEAVKKLRGKPGTDVKITVLREDKGGASLIDFTIKRSIIKIESVKKAEIIEDGIGYIRLVEFQEKTAYDLERGLNKLESQGLKGLILDLRNNPGGLLDAAVEVAGKFLEDGKVIVSTRGRIESQNIVFKSRNRNKHLNYPIVVLVNGGSASASEIVAGALQDNHRGIIMGTRSFGKGSVQTVMPLSDGSAVRLTTSKYFTPLGCSIHGEGIMPDIIVEYKETSSEEKKESRDIFKELVEKETKKDKEIKEREREKQEKYDNQVLSAVDVLKGIIIYNTSPGEEGVNI